MQSITVRIIGREGCHLCDEAHAIIENVASGFSNVVVEHRMVEDNPEWVASYSDKIPVIQLDGAEFAYWRVSAEKLKEQLVARGGRAVAASEERG